MKFIKNIKEISATGSRVICDPAPTDTDEDYIVLVNSVKTATEELLESGWSMSTDYNGETFTSFRRFDINYLVTEKKDFYDKFVLATNVAKSLNLLDKTHRITLFKAILYGKV